ncbi:MAG: ribonuclease P protein component [Lentisphaerae bacterium]|nr:ribonuclease P protein component [Lentisphaerota bacterium]
MTYRTGEGVCGQETVAVTPPPVRFCLPRSSRLASPQYREVFDQGHSTAGRYLVVWAKRRGGEGCSLGVVTSKRTLRTAVARNRARRLLREAFRLNRGALGKGIDLVLIARSRIAEVGRQEVAADFLAVCRRARICRREGHHD